MRGGRARDTFRLRPGRVTHRPVNTVSDCFTNWPGAVLPGQDSAGGQRPDHPGGRPTSTAHGV